MSLCDGVELLFCTTALQETCPSEIVVRAVTCSIASARSGKCSERDGHLPLPSNLRSAFNGLFPLSWVDAGFPTRLHGNGKEGASYLGRTHFPGEIAIHSQFRVAATERVGSRGAI